MTTSLLPLSLRVTVREPLGLLTYFSVKLPRRDRWSVGNLTISPAVQGRWECLPYRVPGISPGVDVGTGQYPQENLAAHWRVRLGHRGPIRGWPA